MIDRPSSAQVGGEGMRAASSPSVPRRASEGRRDEWVPARITTRIVVLEAEKGSRLWRDQAGHLPCEYYLG